MLIIRVMSAMSSRSFAGMSSALELKSTLDDIAQRQGAVRREATNISGLGVNYGGTAKQLVVVTTKKKTFAQNLLPNGESRLVLPVGVMEGTLVTYQNGKDTVRGLVVATPNKKKNRYVMVEPLDDDKFRKWIDDNPGGREVVLNNGNIKTSSEIKRILGEKELSWYAMLMKFLFGWWIPDLDSEWSIGETILRFVVGMGITFGLLYGLGYLVSSSVRGW